MVAHISGPGGEGHRIDAACTAYARRKYEELARDGTSPLAEEAIRRFARIYEIESKLKGVSDEERQALRQQLAKLLWDKLRNWLELERRLVVDGGAAAGAIDYTLNHWAALTKHLDDGAFAIDNNHLERQIKSWAMGRRAWLFAGSQLAGQRAAIVISLVQSARLNGHEPGGVPARRPCTAADATQQPNRRTAAASLAVIGGALTDS